MTEAINKPKARFYPEKSIPNYSELKKGIEGNDANAIKAMAREVAKAIASDQYDTARLIQDISYMGDMMKTQVFLQELVLAQHELHMAPKAGAEQAEVAPEITDITGETAQALELTQEKTPNAECIQKIEALIDLDLAEGKGEMLREIFSEAQDPYQLAQEVFHGDRAAKILKFTGRTVGIYEIVQISESHSVIINASGNEFVFEKNVLGLKIGGSSEGNRYKHLSGTTPAGEPYSKDIQFSLN